MNSDEIYDALRRIEGISSKKSKVEEVARYGESEEFRKVLVAALDPFVTYGLASNPFESKPSPAITPESSGAMFDEKTWGILGMLRDRVATGNTAKNLVFDEMARLTRRSRTLLWAIISKDLRAGFSESTVNKAIPGLIQTFDCMLAHKFDAARIKKWPMVIEPKLDGVRVLAFVDFVKSEVRFFSRSGKEFKTFEHLKTPILKAALDSGEAKNNHFVLDGEVVSGSFNKTVSEVRKKDVQAEDAELHVFDILPNAVFAGGVSTSYTDRRVRLESYVKHAGPNSPIKIIPRYLASSVSEIERYYESVRNRGLEGLIVKDPTASYVTKRSHAWMKIKAEESVDVPIVDAVEGTGKYVGMLGALIVDVDGVQVNVGTGLSDAQRASFYEAWMGDLKRREKYGESWDISGELLGRLVEVEYHEKTPDGSLRHPRFKRFRDDKEVSHE